MDEKQMTSEELGAIQMIWEDAIFLCYLRQDMAEDSCACWIGVDRLTFREKLSEWLKGLMDNAPVPVKGWTHEQ